MKSTIKVFATLLGLALAMTAAYARSDDRSGSPQAPRDAAIAVSRTSQIVIPAALRPPTVTVNCSKVDGLCLTRTQCVGKGGFVSSLPGCPSGTVCCEI